MLLEIQLYSPKTIYQQSWTKDCKQIHKTKQNRFFYGMFYSLFFARFYQKRQNLAFG